MVLLMRMWQNISVPQRTDRMSWLLCSHSDVLSGLLLASLSLASADVCLSRNLFLYKMRPRKCLMCLSRKRLVIIVNKRDDRGVIRKAINCPLSSEQG